MGVCGATGEDYLRVAQDLLPRGAAWPRDTGSTLAMFWRAVAEEFARSHARFCDLLERESDPRTARELLPDWERVAGLPDPCAVPAPTLAERRDRLVEKLRSRGGQSIAFFLEMAGRLGYPGVTIEEFRPFVCAQSRCGDPLNGPATVRFYWRVRVPAPRVAWFRAGASRAGDRLGAIRRAEDLECIFGRLQPAHAALIFAYEGS